VLGIIEPQQKRKTIMKKSKELPPSSAAPNTFEIRPTFSKAKQVENRVGNIGEPEEWQHY
jgi:hypothetical protein